MSSRHLPAALLLALGVPLAAMGCAHRGVCGTVPASAPSNPALLPPPAAANGAEVLEGETLQSLVAKATIYANYARITRRATARATAEPTVFAFRGLPGWVDDGSVQVSASGGRIVDVRVERRFLSRATDRTWLRIEAEHKALLERLAALRDELAVLEAQKRQIESIQAFSVEKITRDTRIGEVKVESYGDVLRFIGDSLRANAEARRAVQRKLDELNPEHQASLKRVEDAKNLMKLEETTVLVTLQASGASPVALELAYMLPGVTWEPVHELRATLDSSRVEVLSYAALTQTSGENWGGAELSFSTQSPMQAVKIPELETLTLGETSSATRILTSQMSSFMRAQAAFEGQNQLWQARQRSGARSSVEHVFRSNIDYFQQVQGRTVHLFANLEKRGTTAHFKAQTARNVRGDGRPVRLLIGHGVLDAKQRIVAAPEQTLNAARTLAMVNSSGEPLLPGKVALYQDGTFLGTTQVDFIAPGERFSVYLSVADHLKLSRELDRKRSALIRKARNQMQLAFVVTVENLSSTEAKVVLTDRVPVSENREIKVDRIAITPTTRPDAQGLVRWDLTLRPRERREFRVSYQVEYPSELVFQTHRRRLRDLPSPSPASPMRPSKRAIEDHIMDMEKALH